MLQEQLFINGRTTPAKNKATRKIVNPATGQPFAEVAEGDAVDIDAAARSAHTAFYDGPWRRFSSSERQRVLLQIAVRIREQAEQLAQLETRNVGKPIREARDEVNLAADCFEYYAGAVNKIGGQTIPVAAAGVSMTFREPIGVCGLILPWNFPIAIASWKIAPALAMGNTVVVKPAEQTPLTALKLAAIAAEAGLPEGVLNVVPGAGETAGEALVRQSLVRKISFTGSTEIGSRVMQLAANDIKRVTLELGGKSANIVFSDADFVEATKAAVWSVLGNAGQDCCARSRLLVERTIYPEFVQEVANILAGIRLGDPLDEKTELGSLISAGHRERVLSYIKSGQEQEARLVRGGEIPTDDNLRSGCFLTPALFDEVRPDMKIAREEIFGPVICASPFDCENEAIAIANNSKYGLSGSIWTRDIERALRVARAVETGVISINTGHSVHLEAPFGGMKQSGTGRELGLAALDHYSELKSIFVRVEQPK